MRLAAEKYSKLKSPFREGACSGFNTPTIGTITEGYPNPVIDLGYIMGRMDTLANLTTPDGIDPYEAARNGKSSQLYGLFNNRPIR